MAAKWKYASLPAEERVERIRKGDKSVYDAEMARSSEVIKARSELGLDTTEQKAWIDRISYNYNLSNAEKMGIDASRVNKTGYADVLLGGKIPSARKSTSRGVVERGKSVSTEDLAIELAQKEAEAGKSRSVLAEWLLNNGIDESSEEGRRFIEETEREIAEKVANYRKSYQAAAAKRLQSLRG